MKPAPFSLARPRTVEDAVALLASEEGVALPLSGGQSLIPLLNARLVRPDLVVDLNRIDDLAGFDAQDERIVLRALCRHSELAAQLGVGARLPILAEAMRFVGSPATRSRGTVGGSLAHAEPSAELPAIALLLDGKIRLATLHDVLELRVAEYQADWARRETRPHVVTALTLHRPKESSTWGFAEISRGFGMGNSSLCGVVLEHRSRSVRKVSIVVAGANLPARRLADLEDRLVGLRTSGSLPDDAIHAAVAGLQLADDPLRGSAAYLRSAFERVVVDALESARARLGEA